MTTQFYNSMYFKKIDTLEELKKDYLRLTKKYHPDMNQGEDTTEVMQKINNEYDKLFDEVKNISKTKDGKIYTKDNNELSEEFKNIVNELIKLNDIEIAIIGSFIWVGGDTYKHKKTFNRLKFRWSRNKQKWYKAPKNYRKASKKQYSYNDIKEDFTTRFEFATEKTEATEAIE